MKLREIMAITDEGVGSCARGEMVATRTTRETSVEELAELMVGRARAASCREGREQSR